jgi:hypothetical protein
MVAIRARAGEEVNLGADQCPLWVKNRLMPCKTGLDLRMVADPIRPAWRKAGGFV